LKNNNKVEVYVYEPSNELKYTHKNKDGIEYVFDDINFYKSIETSWIKRNDSEFINHWNNQI